ncbi:BRCA1 C Terminus (BRCT) protein [Crenobacter luteus]|nr:BRCA1 C Terminus (BRCT) protein [Crenobacter luteus]
MAADLESRGKGAAVRHLVGFVFANIVAGIVFGLASGDASWWQWALALILAGGIYANAKTEHSSVAIAPSPTPRVPSQPSQPSQPPSPPPPFDRSTVAKRRAAHEKELAELQAKRAVWEAEMKRSSAPSATLLEELRQLCRQMTADGSLDVEEISDLHLWLQENPAAASDEASRRLAAALKAAWLDGVISNDEAFELFDLAVAVANRGRVVPVPPSTPSRATPKPPLKTSPSPKPRSRKRGGVLDTIHFSYQNADGDFSSRQVLVQGVKGKYIEGVCLLRNAVRTFRLDRVVGQITSEETGEICWPEEWARQFRDDVPGATFAQDDSSFDAELEVLITGVSAAERARLEGLARDAGMVVRKSVTKNLDYLVAGNRAGPAKLAQALENGAEIIDPAEFETITCQS